MKKALRFLAKGLLYVIALGIVAYVGFRAKEYFVGNKYVGYLEQHHLTTTPITDTATFRFDDGFAENQLFLVGEIHEFETSPIIDRATFRYLHEHAGVRNFIVEMDPVQAYYLKRFLMDSTDLGLQEILQHWAVHIGTASTAYRQEKWGRYKAFYQSLPAEERFSLYGIDVMADTALLRRFLAEKLPEPLRARIPSDPATLVAWAGSHLPTALDTGHYPTADSLLLARVAYDCAIPPDTVEFRDYCLYKNFNQLYHQQHWEHERVYGAFGIAHVLQGVPGTFAEYLIRKGDLFPGRIVSIAPLYTRSHIAIPSNWLPGFLAAQGPYTRLAYGFDNIWLYYIKGIEDFKRTSPRQSINLFKLNGPDSPYASSGRGLASFSLLPVIPKIPMDPAKPMVDYAQYVVYVDGSDWMPPDK